MLNILDEYSRECLCIHVDRQINACKVKKIFSKLIDVHGTPEHIRSDNGSEFIEKGVFENGWQRMRSRRSILKRDAHGRMDTSRVSMRG